MTSISLPSGKIPEAMVEAALDASGHRSAEYSRIWMRRALRAALSVPAPGTGGAEAQFQHKTYRCEWQLVHGSIDQYGNNFEAYETAIFPTKVDAEAARGTSATKNKFNGLWIPNNAPHSYCETQIRYVEVVLSSSPVGEMDGLSEWAGWDQARYPWGGAKHKDAVLEALFRGPWSVEDAAALLGFIDRTWTKRPSSQGGR